MARKKKRKRGITKKRKTQGVKEAMAVRLRKAGYGTLEKLADARAAKLAKELGFKKYLAERLVSCARDVHKEISREEASAEKKTTAEEGKTAKGKIVSGAMQDEGFRRRVSAYVADNLF